MDAIKRVTTAIQQFSDWGREQLKPDSRFQDTATGRQVGRFLAHQEDFQDSVLESSFVGSIDEDGGGDHRLPAWALMSSDDIKRQLAYQVILNKTAQSPRQQEATAERYLARLQQAGFHVLEMRACKVAQRNLQEAAQQLRAVAADESKLEGFRREFIALNGSECFTDTFALAGIGQGLEAFRHALLGQASELERAAVKLDSDHFLHHVDVLKSMPEITRNLEAGLPPGSFARDAFLRGLRAHNRQRRLEQNTATILKLAASLGGAAASAGIGIIGNLVFTGATTLAGSADAYTTYLGHTAAMRRGILSGGMKVGDWYAAEQRRSWDLVRDFVSLAGNAVGAFSGMAPAATSAGVQIGVAAEKIARN